MVGEDMRPALLLRLSSTAEFFQEPLADNGMRPAQRARLIGRHSPILPGFRRWATKKRKPLQVRAAYLGTSRLTFVRRKFTFQQLCRSASHVASACSVI